MLSDEEKDNEFKITVPIITNDELRRFDLELETDLNKIVNEILEHISRDREIILLKKVIEKQSKEIEALKKKTSLLKSYKANLPDNVELICLCKNDFQRNISDDYISKDKIKAKIEELKEDEDFYREQDRMCEYDGKIKLLQSLLEEEE